jgi:hypothetical protein
MASKIRITANPLWIDRQALVQVPDKSLVEWLSCVMLETWIHDVPVSAALTPAKFVRGVLNNLHFPRLGNQRHNELINVDNTAMASTNSQFLVLTPQQ